MSALSIQPTYPIFTETDGQPLEDGYIWLGVANLDPQGNPINVYWDAALTQLAGQPIRTQGGYPVNSGTPARLYVNSDYSIRVMNKNGSTVYSAPAATERYGNIINLVDLEFLQSGAGAVPRTALSKMRDEKNVLDYGADPTGSNSSVTAINAAIAANEEITFPPGTFLLSDEILIDKSIKINCAPANEYGAGGTIFMVAHNNAAKAGFKVGTVVKNIRFEMTGEPEFDSPNAAFSSFAGLWCEAATVFVDGVRSTFNLNGVYINNCYIGYVKRIQGTGKAYLCKVTGDSSLTFEECNIGSSTGGLASFQIETSGGYVRLEDVYLEAQSARNLAITNCSRTAIHIDSIYAENSANYDIFISDSENIVIENYRTNTNTEAIIIQGSSNVKLNNIHAVDRLGLNELVDIGSTCNNIYVGGVLYDPISSDGSDIRRYALVRGVLAGSAALPSVVNPDLSLSGRGTTSTVGGASISSSVPSDTRMLFSNHSIVVDNANPLKIPITKYGQYRSIVLQVIYQSAAVSNLGIELGIWKNNATQILGEIKYFHKPSADFQMLTFVTRLPATVDLDQYSSLEFRVGAGETALVHYLNMSEYDGGMLPFGFIDESVLFVSDPVTLNSLGSRANLVPKIGNKLYRLKQYELVYATSTGGAGADATVGMGEANSSGTIAVTGCTFTTALNQGPGLPCNSLADTGPYPFRDHVPGTTANGWVVEVLAAGGAGGTAQGFVRAVPIEPNTI